MGNMGLDFFQTNYSRKPNLLLLFLIAVDFLFIIGHLYVLYYGSSDSSAFRVDTDQGYPEVFQYLKFLTISGIIAYMVVAQKKVYYISWGFVFFLLLIDDAFQLHEKIGEVLAYWFDFQPMMGLKPRDLGELVYMASVGTGVVMLVWYSYIKASIRFTYSCWDIGILLCLFLFFAVGIGMLHSIMEKKPVIGDLLALFEDGGEMLAISILTWYFSFIASAGSEDRPFFFQFFVPFAIKSPPYKDV